MPPSTPGAGHPGSGWRQCAGPAAKQGGGHGGVMGWHTNHRQLRAGAWVRTTQPGPGRNHRLPTTAATWMRGLQQDARAEEAGQRGERQRAAGQQHPWLLARVHPPGSQLATPGTCWLLPVQPCIQQACPDHQPPLMVG